MKNNTKIIIAVLVVIAIAAFVYYKKIDTQIIIDQTPSQNDGAVATSTATSTKPSSQGKINIDVVCQGALAYMTFKDGASADAFVAECKEGKHPEVIERFKVDMNLGDGAKI